METTKKTYWYVTSEGKKKTFYSEEELNDYISKTRPANDDFFEINKVTEEICTYTIKSNFDKRTIDKQLMVDLLHNLGQKLISSGKYIDIDRIIKYKLEDIYGIKDAQWEQRYKIIGELLANATVDDIENDFTYNFCDLKGCHNYLITYSNKASRDEKKACQHLNLSDYDERLAYRKKHKAMSFSIQFRPYSKSIVCVGAGFTYYGTHVKCISSKKMPFTMVEYEQLNNFINKRFQ